VVAVLVSSPVSIASRRSWREEGLRVPAQRLERHRVGTSTVPANRLAAERPNHVWALDFLFDVTSDGRPVKASAMCDEFTRESVGDQVARSITADAVTRVLDAAWRYGAPEYLRCDNGPEFTAAACATGAASRAPARRSSSRAVPGRRRT
jgi:putative transposase